MERAAPDRALHFRASMRWNLLARQFVFCSSSRGTGPFYGVVGFSWKRVCRLVESPRPLLELESDVYFYETPKTLSFLSDLSTVTFIDISGLDCKGTTMLGKGHGIALTECFAEHETKDKNIIKFLEEIF